MPAGYTRTQMPELRAWFGGERRAQGFRQVVWQKQGFAGIGSGGHSDFSCSGFCLQLPNGTVSFLCNADSQVWLRFPQALSLGDRPLGMTSKKPT